MSERGRSKPAPPRPAAVVSPAPSISDRTGIDAASRMEVTESCISDTMIQQMFRRRPTDEISSALDD